jgi:Leucine-rich repeat (LRR) protein
LHNCSNFFSGLKNLVKFSADNNRLKTIAPNAFAGASALETVSLASNRLTLRSGEHALQYGDVVLQSPFSSLFKLRELDLRDNSIADVFTDWRIVLIANLKRLDLSGNNITELTVRASLFASDRYGNKHILISFTVICVASIWA